MAARTPAKHLGAGPLDFTYEKRSSSPKQGDVEVPAGGARKDFVNSLQIGRTRGIPWLASTDLEGLAGVAVGRALLGHEEFARAYQHGPRRTTRTDDHRRAPHSPERTLSQAIPQAISGIDHLRRRLDASGRASRQQSREKVADRGTLLERQMKALRKYRHVGILLASIDNFRFTVL